VRHMDLHKGFLARHSMVDSTEAVDAAVQVVAQETVFGGLQSIRNSSIDSH
jgi:hypothetical protein